MELAFPVVWCCRGYALKGERVVGKLEGTIKTLYCFGNVEVGSFVFNVVYLERVENKEIRRSWDCSLRVKEDALPIPLYMDSSV